MLCSLVWRGLLSDQHWASGGVASVRMGADALVSPFRMYGEEVRGDPAGHRVVAPLQIERLRSLGVGSPARAGVQRGQELPRREIGRVDLHYSFKSRARLGQA